MSDTGAETMRARLLAVAVVGVLAVPAGTAPVPKALQKARPVTVSLAPDRVFPDTLTVTVSNHTDEPVSWQSTTSPLACCQLEFRDGKGGVVDSRHPDALCSPFAPPGHTYTAPPGDTFVMQFVVANCFEDGTRPSGKLTLTVTFTHAGQRYESEPLEVK